MKTVSYNNLGVNLGNSTTPYFVHQDEMERLQGQIVREQERTARAKEFRKYRHTKNKINFIFGSAMCGLLLILVILQGVMG